MRDPALREVEAWTAKRHSVVLALSEVANPEKPPPPARTVEYYKSHSLAASNWGALVPSGQPLRPVSAEEAQETVLRGLLDTPMDKRRQNPFDFMVSTTIHVAVVAALVIIPLAFTQVIDLNNFQATYLAMPRPPAAAPAPLPPAAPETAKRVVRPIIHPAVLTMPRFIPRKIAEIRDEEPPNVDAGGVLGGIQGGANGGVLGGVLGGTQGGPAAIPAPLAPKKTVYRVGGDFKAPRQITNVAPDYPIIARQARMEGIVTIDAVIDENGNVAHARVVSGPGLLTAAAVRAVMQWRYQPTYLDGSPVSIAMEVQVYFRLQ